MTAKEELEAIDSEIKSLEQKEGDIREKLELLHEARDPITQRVVVEEKMLEGTEWNLQFNSYGRLYLHYVNSVRSDEMDKVVKLCWEGWHSTFMLDDSTRLEFDDNQVSISFGDATEIPTLASKYGLKITADGIEQKAEILRQELESLDSVLGQFKS